MKVVGRVPIYPGPNGIFGPDEAQKLVGKKTKDGALIIAAEQTYRNEIWLTIEMEVEDDDIFHGKEFLVFGTIREADP